MAKKQTTKANETSIKKGEVRNPRGRPKGAISKQNKQIKATIEMVMDSLAETIIEDLAQVNSSRRLQVYIDLMNYIKPKLSSSKNENTNEVKGDIKVNISFGDVLNLSTEDEGGEDE